MKWERVYQLGADRRRIEGLENFIWPSDTTTLDSDDVLQRQTNTCVDHFRECVQARRKSPLGQNCFSRVSRLHGEVAFRYYYCQ